MSEQIRWRQIMLRDQAWWAVWPGLILFLLLLPISLGADLPGWLVQPRAWEWSSFWQAPGWEQLFYVSSHSASGNKLGVIAAWFVTYLIISLLLGLAVWLQGKDLKSFLTGFTCLYLFGWAGLILGHEAHFSAVLSSQSYTQPAIYGEDLFCLSRLDECDRQINEAFKAVNIKLKPGQHPTVARATEALGQSPDLIRLSWSLQLGGAVPYILALIIGLLLGRYASRLQQFVAEALRAEWFIQLAMVCFGASLARQSLQLAGYSGQLLMTTAVAASVCFFLVWPAVYTMARRVFELSRSHAVMLAAGVAGGGIFALFMSGAATRSRAIIPTIMAVLVLVFATLELTSLPRFYASLSEGQPIVNGAALGLTMKSAHLDGSAAVLLDARMTHHHYRTTGTHWDAGIISATANLARYWLTLLVILWSILLAWLWCRYAVDGDDDVDEPAKSHAATWRSMPPFLLGLLLICIGYLLLARGLPGDHGNVLLAAQIQGETIVEIFLILAFISVGMNTDREQLKGIGKQIWLYAVGILVLVPPVAYLFAYLFHNGLLPLADKF